jgi:hypothetical protein
MMNATIQRMKTRGFMGCAMEKGYLAWRSQTVTVQPY